jgi:hypothetical protein
VFVAPAAPTAQSRTLDEVLAAAGVYVQKYETELTALLAEERYEQSVSGPRMRRIRQRLESDFLFLRLPGSNEWLGFRDVHTVDKKPVRPRDDRLARLLIDPEAHVRERARAIVEESAKYNIGRPKHTVNVPQLVLDWVRPSIRPRLSFEKRSEDRSRGRSIWGIAFKERGRPTLVRTSDGGEALSEGMYRIEAGTGRILETELVSRAVEMAAVSRVRVRYSPDPRLEILVPVEMQEQLDVPPNRATGRATYRNFRRFEATARIKQGAQGARCSRCAGRPVLTALLVVAP